MDAGITRRSLIGRGAALAVVAAAGFDPFEALAQGRRGVHCLSPVDQFRPVRALRDCSFAAFSASGATVACGTPAGIRVGSRKGGSGAIVSPPGFILGSGDAWHPSGEAIVATGPLGVGLFALRPVGGAPIPLLADLPGKVRAPAFSPDGRLVAFTYVDRFVHRLVIADWIGGPNPALSNPRVLIPFDPQTEPDPDRMRQGLAWHETRGFTPDGQYLLFASDRDGGMLNANLYRLHMPTGAVRQLTREDGFVEGGFVGRGGNALFYGSMRAREPGFLTLVTGSEVPPFLGFAAGPALHDQLVSDFRARIGNGDIIATAAGSGLSARIVARRDVIGRTVRQGGAESSRILACGMTRDGRFLAAAALSPGGSSVALFERESNNVPKARPIGATPVPPIAAPLSPGSLGDRPIERSVPGPAGGKVELTLDGTLEAGSFEASFLGYSDNGLNAFNGPLRFELDPFSNAHTADVVRRLADEEEEGTGEARIFYRANMRVARPDTAGELSSRSSRYGTLSAVGTGRAFAALGSFKPGRRKEPIGVPGAFNCPPRSRR